MSQSVEQCGTFVIYPESDKLHFNIVLDVDRFWIHKSNKVGPLWSGDIGANAQHAVFSDGIFFRLEQYGSDECKSYREPLILIGFELIKALNEGVDEEFCWHNGLASFTYEQYILNARCKAKIGNLCPTRSDCI